MGKYFYFVVSDPMYWLVDKEGNACGCVHPDQVRGQTRELAREIKRDWYYPEDKPVICKFDRNPPYKFLGVVS